MSQVAVIFVGLVDIAVQEFEAEPLGPGLLQQPLRLGPRFLDIGPIPSDLLQLLLGGGQWRAGKDDAADRVDIGDLCELAGAPCQRSIAKVNARLTRGIVERLFLVIGVDDRGAIPIAFLDGDLVAERT